MAEYIVFVDSANRNSTLYPSANSYTIHLINPIRNVSRVELVCATLPKGSDSNAFASLDIQEFRTPFRTDALKLESGATLNGATLQTSNSLNSSGTFAVIPWDVATNTTKYFKELSDFKISVEYPSRLDTVDRLTVQWTDTKGKKLIGFGNHEFILRLYSVYVPVEPERPLSLPAPVPLERKLDPQLIIGAVLVFGLVVLLFIKRR